MVLYFYRDDLCGQNHLSVQNLSKQDLIQDLHILLDNATKYGDKKISIVLDKNSLAVTNDGVTIPKKDQERVFDRFYQTDKIRDGSGLGLAIAKALCEQNGWKNKKYFPIRLIQLDDITSQSITLYILLSTGLISFE